MNSSVVPLMYLLGGYGGCYNPPCMSSTGGMQCSMDADCGGLSQGFCNSGVCSCQLGQVEMDGTCYAGRKLQEECDNAQQCLMISEHTACESNICVCQAGFWDNGDGLCRPMNEIRLACDNDGDCSDLVNGICKNSSYCCCPENEVEVASACYPGRNLDSSCMYHQQCQVTTKSSICDAGMCICRHGYWNKGDDICRPITPLGVSCATDDDCAGPDGWTCVDDMCSCPDGQATVYWECYPGATLGDGCQHSQQCQAKAANSMCEGSKCVCKDSYSMDDAGYACYQDIKLGDNCTVNEDCIGLANGICDSSSSVCVCPDDRIEIEEYCYDGSALTELCMTDEQCQLITNDSRCYQRYCECATGFFTLDNTACQPETKTGVTCATNDECAGPNSICVSQECICEADYVDVNQVCIRKAGLTKACENNEQCSGQNENSECKTDTGKCGCTDDFQSKDGMCVAVVKVNDTCSVNSDCGDALCVNLLCACSAEQVVVDGKCYNHKDFMESCENDEQCQAVASNSECVTVCTCPSPLENYGDNQCQDAVRTGATCTSDSDCDPSSILSCGAASTCDCALGYTEVNNKCYPDRDPWQSCIIDQQCQAADLNNYCGSSYKCVCAAGFWNSQNECRQDVPLGGACQYDMDCYNSDPNTRCRGDVCAVYSRICHETTIGGYRYRLADSADDCKAGRIEVRRVGVDEPWGVVCHDKFNTAAANVFCKSIGFTRHTYLGYGQPRIGNSDIYYISFITGCIGTEAHLVLCNTNSWGILGACTVGQQVVSIRCI